jgi:hypothetical protein
MRRAFPYDSASWVPGVNMFVPSFDDMVAAIRQTIAERRLLSRTPLSTLIHFELLKSLSDLEIYGNRAGVREAYACLYEYDALNGRKNGVTNGAQHDRQNGHDVSLAFISVSAADRLMARTHGD